MLASLSDREHEVYSAVAIVHDACEIVTLSVTCVRFAAISPTQAAAYWNSGEPADKAGRYGIQGLGAVFLREIRGPSCGVGGMPPHETTALLQTIGIKPLYSSTHETTNTAQHLDAPAAARTRHERH